MSHDPYEPRLRIKASGYGGSGYAIPRADGSKLKVPGVTTVLNVLPKGGVVQWAVDNTVSYIIANLDSVIDEYDDDAIFRRYRWYHTRTPKPDDIEIDANNYHVGVLHDAADTGTRVHDWIADNIQGNFEPDIEKPEQAEAVGAYLEWLEDHEVRPILVEATVVNEELGYAGTFDHIWDVKCLHEGDPCLPESDTRAVRTFIDVKTSKAIYDSHVAQLAALTNAEYLMREVGEGEGVEYKTPKWGKTYWVTEDIPEFEHVAILQCRFEDFDKDGNDVPAFCKLTYLDPARLEIGFEIFKSALKMQLSLKDYKDWIKNNDA